MTEPKKDLEIGQFPLSLSDMSSAEMKAHIQECGRQMTAAYARYERSNCFADRGAADGWRLRMEAAIAMRKPSAVKERELALGLA